MASLKMLLVFLFGLFSMFQLACGALHENYIRPTEPLSGIATRYVTKPQHRYQLPLAPLIFCIPSSLVIEIPYSRPVYYISTVIGALINRSFLDEHTWLCSGSGRYGPQLSFS